MTQVRTSQTSWKRTLYALCFAQLVAIAGFSMVLPILPLYVRELGVQDEGEVALWAGLVYSSQALTMAIFSPIWGSLSDRHGRKIMVERAMFGGAVLVGLMGLAQNVQQLALLRFVQGVVTGIVTAGNALAATSAPRERAGYALGMMQMALYVGASGGPLLGGLVSDTLGYRWAFYITGGLLFLAGVIVLIFVRESFEPVASAEDLPGSERRRWTVRARFWHYLSPVLSSTPLLIVLGIYLLTRAAGRLVSPVLALYVESLAPPDARVATLTGLISGSNAAAAALGSVWLGGLCDRIGARRILIAGTLGAALCYFPQALVPAAIWLVPLQAGAGLAMGGIMAANSVSLARLSPKGQEGIVYGVSGSAMAAANLLGPMTGSALAAGVGLSAPFLASAGVYGLSTVVAAVLMPRDQRPIPEHPTSAGATDKG
jgi:DHA1 family multidrug resistance protein-like MFS transporter